MHIAEARSFVEASEQRWDLIQLALLDSFTAAAAGVQALGESPLYTVEALQAYYEHLAPGGLLAITRWLLAPPRDPIKLFATAVLALERMGASSPGDQLAMIHSWNTATLLMKNGQFNAAEIAVIRAFANTRSFDVAWYPACQRQRRTGSTSWPNPICTALPWRCLGQSGRIPGRLQILHHPGD